MTSLSTVCICTDANKFAAEAEIGFQLVREVRPIGGTTTTHWLAHDNSCDDTRAKLLAAESLGLLSVDVDHEQPSALAHTEAVLALWGLEFADEDPT